MIRIVAADDHWPILEGLEMLFEGIPNISLTGKALNGGSLLALVRDQKPDVALVDISLGDENGIALVGPIFAASPNTKVIMFTMHCEPHFIRLALQAGVQGYLLKNTDKQELQKAVEQVMAGNPYHSPKVTEIGMKLHAKGAVQKEGRDQLTKRELEVLILICDGYTNQKMAEALFLSLYTIETHRKHLMSKAGVKNTAELVRWAIENGLYPPTDRNNS